MTTNGARLYDIAEGYWAAGPGERIIAVTDDLTWGRSFILQRVSERTGRELTAQQFACFEERFVRFQDGAESCLYFAVSDISFYLRESRLKVAIGGMSTI